MKQFIISIPNQLVRVTWTEEKDEFVTIEKKQKTIQAENLKNAVNIARIQIQEFVQLECNPWNSGSVYNMEIAENIDQLFSVREYSPEDEMEAAGAASLFNRDEFLVVPA